MQDAQNLFGHPGIGLLSMLVIGAIAGWIAEKVTDSDHGILTNILVGICGAFIGGKLAGCCKCRSSVFGARWSRRRSVRSFFFLCGAWSGAAPS